MKQEEKLLLILALGFSLLSFIFVAGMMAEVEQANENINHLHKIIMIWSK
jgi:hypothetical protein